MATLDKKLFYEIVDERRLKQLIKSNVIDNEKKALLKGYSKLKTDRGYRVEYNFVKEFYDKGRVYPTNSLSLCSFSRKIRGFLVNNLRYIDIDIKNCYPVLLSHLYKEFGMENEYLDAYINGREQCFAKYHFEKTDFLKVINDKNYVGNNVFLKNFHNNLFKLIPILKEHCKDIYGKVFYKVGKLMLRIIVKALLYLIYFKTWK